MRRDFGRGLIVRSSYTIHDSFATTSHLFNLLLTPAFLICLTLTIVILLRFWLNVGLATALCDVSQMSNLAHKGWKFERETRSTHWLRPKATNSSTMDSNLWEKRADV
jgi:hypothetical protein